MLNFLCAFFLQEIHGITQGLAERLFDSGKLYFQILVTYHIFPQHTPNILLNLLKLGLSLHVQ